MINRTIYNLLIQNKDIKELLAKHNNAYAIFTYSLPKNINYPAIVFKITKYESDVKIETNKLTIDIYSEKHDSKNLNRLAALIMDHLDKKIITYPDCIDLRLYLSSGSNYREEYLDNINRITLSFLVRGPFSKWGVI